MTKKITKRNLSGWEWRRVKKDGKEVLQRRRKTELVGQYESFTLEDLDKRVADVGYEDPELEIDEKTDWGESYPYLYVNGWTDATDEEVAEEIAKMQSVVDSRAEREQMEIERLRKSRPELFKEI